MPIGAFLTKERSNVFQPGDHGSTFGGNPLTCAAAHASTKYIIDNNVPEHARQMGEYLEKGLNGLRSNHEFISDVRGLGLLWAIEFNSEMSPAITSACNEAGLLLNPLRPTAIRLMPPLTVTSAEIDEALDRLETGLNSAAGGSGA